jgi:Flp pilus assembly pilin Flp
VRLLRCRLRDTSGQALAEYAILLALVAVGLIGALILLRDAVGGVYAHTGTQIEQAATPSDPASGNQNKGKGCGDGVGGGRAAGGCAVGKSK